MAYLSSLMMERAPEVDYVVPGQLWYDKLNNNLYIWAGDNAPDGSQIWRLLADLDQDFLQTTATLPLSVIGPKIAEARAIDDLNYIPTDDASDSSQFRRTITSFCLLTLVI